MNYLRKAFNLYQMTHRVDASTTDIKALDNDNDVEEEAGSKNAAADSTRSAATKARANDVFAKRVVQGDLYFLGWSLFGLGEKDLRCSFMINPFILKVKRQVQSTRSPSSWVLKAQRLRLWPQPWLCL